MRPGLAESRSGEPITGRLAADAAAVAQLATSTSLGKTRPTPACVPPLVFAAVGAGVTACVRFRSPSL